MAPKDETLKVNQDSTPDELRRAAEARERELRVEQKYPGWRYHKTLPAVIVNSPADEKALGSGWSEEQFEGNTALAGNASPESLRALALETELLADRTAEIAGVQSPNDKERARSVNALKEATGGRGPGKSDARTETLRQAGAAANKRDAETTDEARKAAEYFDAEEKKRTESVEGHPDSFRARKGAAKSAAKKAPASKPATAKKTAAKKGKLGGTRK